MDQLPAELLCQITVLCDEYTLFRLRSVSKQVRDVVTPLAFEHMRVGWMKEHLEYLESLATSPLAKHVRRLTVNTEMLPRFDDSEWTEYLRLTTEHEDNGLYRNREDESETKFFCSQRNLIIDWDRYHTIATHQPTYSSFCGDKLLSALGRLVKVQSLELIDGRNAQMDEGRPACPRLASCSPWNKTSLKRDDYSALLRERWNEERERPGKADMSSAWTLRNIADAFAARRSDEKRDFVGPVKELKIHTGHHIPVSKVLERTNCMAGQAREPDIAVFPF